MLLKATDLLHANEQDHFLLALHAKRVAIPWMMPVRKLDIVNFALFSIGLNLRDVSDIILLSKPSSELLTLLKPSLLT